MIKSYQLISALGIFKKILEKLIFNSLFNHVMQIKLFTEHQSNFILLKYFIGGRCHGYFFRWYQIVEKVSWSK